MNDIAPVLALSIAATCCLPASARQLDVARFLKERGAESAELRQLARSPSPAVVPVATSYISMFRSDAGKQLVAVASIAYDGTLKVEKALSADINGAGATGDIRAARTALSQRLGAIRNPPTRQ